jgi:hypothetical protein
MEAGFTDSNETCDIIFIQTLPGKLLDFLKHFLGEFEWLSPTFSTFVFSHQIQVSED